MGISQFQKYMTTMPSNKAIKNATVIAIHIPAINSNTFSILV
jgi:hypothetical protein